MVGDADILNAFGRLPSVTQILAAVGLGPDYERVPSHLLEHARRRGQALHAAIQYHHEGSLDPESIHPEVASGLTGYLKFMVDSGHEPLYSEIEVIHPTWKYVGHPDRIGWLNGKLVLIDFKYMESVTLHAATYQLAAYRMAWDATHPAEPLEGSFVLQLKRDGTYRLHAAALDSQAEQVFLAALIVYRAIEESKR